MRPKHPSHDFGGRISLQKALNWKMDGKWLAMLAYVGFHKRHIPNSCQQLSSQATLPKVKDTPRSLSPQLSTAWEGSDLSQCGSSSQFRWDLCFVQGAIGYPPEAQPPTLPPFRYPFVGSCDKSGDKSSHSSLDIKPFLARFWPQIWHQKSKKSSRQASDAGRWISRILGWHRLFPTCWSIWRVISFIFSISSSSTKLFFWEAQTLPNNCRSSQLEGFGPARLWSKLLSSGDKPPCMQMMRSWIRAQTLAKLRSSIRTISWIQLIQLQKKFNRVSKDFAGIKLKASWPKIRNQESRDIRKCFNFSWLDTEALPKLCVVSSLALIKKT